MLKFCVTLLIVTFFSLSNAKTYSVTAAGKLDCCAKSRRPCPAYLQRAQVEMWERHTITSDKLLSTAYADTKTGNVIITGSSEHTIRSFDPYLVIKHNCGAKPHCSRKLTLPIPQGVVKTGHTFIIDHLDLDKPHLGKNEDAC